MYDNTETSEEKDNFCPRCGLRQYGNICANCGTKIKDEDEREKTKDDDDEYDWREKR